MRGPLHAVLLVVLVVGLGSEGQARGASDSVAQDLHGEFTGEIKPVLYVEDVVASGEFFRDVLGFELVSWADNEESPYYVDMAAGEQTFGLHEPRSEADEERVGRQKLYFRVHDLEAHRARVEAWGVEAGPVRETAWMTMFTVVDPDGHEIVFAMTEPGTHSIDPW